ncbi:NF-kappa-B inhibitor epsilon [Latimeria chalumnae]|uniref:NF-kappa-B inhibitor epsilon n=1 Tax=Latimeria chalumnae TaxID=7897 RepID=UPI00313F2BBB
MSAGREFEKELSEQFDPDDVKYDSGIESIRSLNPDDYQKRDPPSQREEGDKDRAGERKGGRGGEDGGKGEHENEERTDSCYGSSSITEPLLESVQNSLRITEEEPASHWEESGLAIETLAYYNEDGDTFLHLSIIHEAQDLSLLFISLLPKEILEIQNNLLQTPLHLAVYLNQPVVVRALVLKGASLELQDRNGNTPLHLACKAELNNCVGELLRDLSEEELEATGCNPGSRIHLDLELQNWQGLTCLHIATLCKSCPLIELLLQKGANINTQEGTSGKTPLHLAVELHNSEVVTLLLSREAYVDAMMYNGCTPLHLAVGRKDATIASILCQFGADTLLRNSEDETAQDMADGCTDFLALFPFDDLMISGMPVVCGE